MVMTHRLALLFALASSVAHADEAPRLDVFLEQRVAEELAADGMPLSRLAVALDVEIVGDKAIVSLVDPGTRRVVASTKLDRLPVDRDAAIASLTQVAANLATQVQPRTPDARRDDNEERYRRESIQFVHLSEYQRPVLYRNHRRLTHLEVYEAIERPDLVARDRRQHRQGAIVAIVGGAITAAGIYIAATGRFRDDDRPDSNQHLTIGGLTAAVGLATAGFGALHAGSGVTSEDQILDLAEEHNTKLRQRLKLAPQVGRDGGGVTLSGRF
jgi:hypothetical protein